MAKKSKKSKTADTYVEEETKETRKTNYEDRDAESSQNSTTMYLLIGILLLVVVIGYFYYNNTSPTSQPETLTIENAKTNKEQPHNKSETWKLIHENIKKRSNPNVLIIGNDTPNGIVETIQWNKGGQTIAILGQKPHEDINPNFYTIVNYQGNQWKSDDILKDPSRYSMLSFTLPQVITDSSWDIIIVDHAVGEKAGGLQSIYAAKELAHSGTDLYFIDIKNPLTMTAIKSFFKANPKRTL
jgi:hypothetical protein